MTITTASKTITEISTANKTLKKNCNNISKHINNKDGKSKQITKMAVTTASKALAQMMIQQQ